MVLGDPQDLRRLVYPGEPHCGAYSVHSSAIPRRFTSKPAKSSVLSVVRELLSAAEGVEVLDEAKMGGYPTAVTEASGSDPVYVGRIREDISHERGISIWVVADNVRKGAALNSVQIAEILVREYL